MKIKLTVDNQTYEVIIEDIQSRPVIAVVEGQRFEVWPEEETSTPVPFTSTPRISRPEQTSTEPSTSSGTGDNLSNKVTSPLPGVIVEVFVSPGETVRYGDVLCTLEAMKMKNAIRASRDGVIASVEVQVGDQVSHGQSLLTFQE